jgi:hypothetical protein
MDRKTAVVLLKMFDIFLLTAYYFVLAFFSATAIDTFLGKYEDRADEEKSTVRLFSEAIIHTFLLLIIFYLARNLVDLIPFPFDGLYGFQHSRVKERGGDVVFVFIIFFYQDYYTKKLQTLYNRLMGHFIKPEAGSAASASG